MGLFSSKTSGDDKYAKTGRARVEVHTNKRSYSWLGGPKSVEQDDDEYTRRAETKGFWGKK